MNKTALISRYLPGGEVAQKLQQRQQVAEKIISDRNQKVNEQMLPAIVGLGILGLGAGLTGTKLYNIVSQLNAPKDKYTKFGPGPKQLDEEEKIAEGSNWTQTILDALASVPKSMYNALNSGAETFGKLTPNQQAILLPAGLLSAGLGIYGGNAIAQGLTRQKKKEDLEHELAEARKEYQKALTGKRASTLDGAFKTYAAAKKEKANKQASDLLSGLATTADWLAEPMRRFGLWPLYTTAVLGTGLLSGKMTYDWTRERSADKALERARRSRARMEEAAPLYIDPAQLEAIKTLHQKEIDKIKQKELV